MVRMDRFMKRVVIVLILIMLYFTILLPFSDTIISFTQAFIEEHGDMFRFNTTKYNYYYNETSGQIERIAQIETVDYTPFVEFIVFLIIYFILPIVVPIVILFKWR